MKYVILHGEGMVDGPHKDLGGKTPLQAAATPNMDGLARTGELGLAVIATEGVTAGRPLSALALLGYDLRKYQSGLAPFEAASQGVALGEHDVAFRCSLVTLRSGAPKGKAAALDEIKKLGPQVVMDDAAAGGVSNDQAREVIDAINEQLGSEAIQFYPGEGHRNLMVWVGGKARAACHDPREVAGQAIGPFLPTGDGADILRKVMESSLVILQGHPVNLERRDAGLKPANCIWLWAPGRAPKIPKLTERYQLTGAIVSGRELVRGIGIYAGLDAVSPSGSAEAGETDFLALAEAGLRELEKKDLVYVHGKMPSDVARGADPKAKVKVVEEFDRKLVGTLLDGLSKLGSYRLVLVCDRPSVGKPGEPASPALYVLSEGPGGAAKGRGGFNEADAEAAGAGARDATRLINRLLNKG
jgi:2,3-bisphosphoglycerate-independent phosphoglycerate mutase